MNVAICDETSICADMEQYVESAFWDLPYKYSCTSFHSCDALLKHLESKPLDFQIYLLDIAMDGHGLDAARCIRRTDQAAVIIFTSSHGELMPKAFRVLAFDFLVKPLKQRTVVEALQSAVHLLEQHNALYLYSVKKKIYSLYLTQIEYIESLGRKIIIHTIDGAKQEYNGSLKDALNKVEHRGFAQIHKSFLVNLEKIANLTSWAMTMRSGAVLGIGNKYHAAFHSAYGKFRLDISSKRQIL